MFLLNGKPLALDVPFVTEDGTQYPANWLRLTSAEEKEAIGITESEEPVAYDDRFYWGPGIPKDLAQLQNNIISQIKATAGSLLAATDWKVVRAAEGVKPVDEDTLDKRKAIREASNLNEQAVLNCKTVEELADLKLEWPLEKETISEQKLIQDTDIKPVLEENLNAA